MRAHACEVRHSNMQIWESWLRLRSAARRLAPLRGSGLTLLIALALIALAFLAAALALSVLGLSVLCLTILGLTVPAAAFLARREIGRRRLFIPANDDLGAIGQVGKTGRHHAIGGRQAARDDGIRFVLLRHQNRLCRYNIAVADDVAEGPGRTALHGGARYNHRLCDGFDLEPHIDELARPKLEIGIGKFGLELERPGGRIDLVVDAGQLAAIDHRYPIIAEHIDSQRALGGGGIDADDLLLRQAELHRDRLQLGDDDQPGDVSGMDDVALIDLTQAGAA